MPAPTPTEVVEAPVTGQGFIDNPDAGAANCRVGPDEGQEVIISLEHGAEVATLGEPVDGWQPVICSDPEGVDQDGYVRADFVSATPPVEASETPESTGSESVPDEPTPEGLADEIEGAEDTAPAPDETESPESTSEPVATDEPTLEPATEPEFVTRDAVIFTASDTSVTQSEPYSPQSEDAVSSLQVGGESGAIAVLTFEVDGVDDGTVVDAQLVITGAGEASGSGGQLRVIDGVPLGESSTTWNDIANAGGGNAGEIGWIEPGGETVTDVTGIVTADGTVSFVIEGTPGQQLAVASTESGTPAYLVLTIESQSGDPAP